MPVNISQVNVPRFVMGGLAAGVLLNVVTAVGNATLFKAEFVTWAADMGGHLHPPSPGSQITLWTVMCFLDAVLGLWIYVGLRPRFGSGPKTALMAGLLVWLIGRFCVALDMIGLGVFPLTILLEQSLLGLAAILPGVLLGAWIYQEKGGDQT